MRAIVIVSLVVCELDSLFTGYPSMSSMAEVNIFRSVCLIFRKISEHSRLVIIKVYHAPYIWLFLPLLLTN